MSALNTPIAMLFRTVAFALQLLPMPLVQRIGALLGRSMMLSKRRLTITHSNVDHAFPDKDRVWKGAVVRGSYENLGIALVELAKFPSLSAEQLLQRVTITGLDEVRQRANEGKPSILISGHYGNWEWMAIAAGLVLQHPLTIVTHPQHNQKLDALLNTYRTRFGNRLVPMHDAARTLVRTMHNGGVVAFLADQHASPERDPWISFFGRETPTYAAPAALSLRMDAPLFFGVAERQDDGTYNVNVTRIPSDDLVNSETSITELTRRHVQVLEDAVRRKPDLWSWQHRRWRKPKPLSTIAHDENRYAEQTPQQKSKP